MPQTLIAVSSPGLRSKSILRSRSLDLRNVGNKVGVESQDLLGKGLRAWKYHLTLSYGWMLSAWHWNAVPDNQRKLGDVKNKKQVRKENMIILGKWFHKSLCIQPRTKHDPSSCLFLKSFFPHPQHITNLPVPWNQKQESEKSAEVRSENSWAPAPPC